MHGPEVLRRLGALAALGLGVIGPGCGRGGELSRGGVDRASPHQEQSCDASVLEFLERHAPLGSREFRRRGLVPPAAGVLRQCVVHASGSARMFAAALLVYVLREELPREVALEFAGSSDGDLRILAVQSALVGERATLPTVGFQVGWALLATEHDPVTRWMIFGDLLNRDVYRSQRTMLEELRRELLVEMWAGDGDLGSILFRLKYLVPQGPSADKRSREEAEAWTTWLEANVGRLEWHKESRGFRLCDEFPREVAREFAGSSAGDLRMRAVQSALDGERAAPPALGFKLGWALLATEHHPDMRWMIFGDLLMRDVYRSQRTMLEELRRELLVVLWAGDVDSLGSILSRLKDLVPQGPSANNGSREEAEAWATWLEANVGRLEWPEDSSHFRLSSG
jgi:hypothetical protein